MNIILTGYRGTGKSSIAPLLSEKFGQRLIITDNLILEEIQTPIKEFICKNGWAAFREIESKVVKKVSQSDNATIDCGGGVVERAENIDLLKKNGIIILLIADVKTILRRICDDKLSARPSLRPGRSMEDEIREVLKARNDQYLSAADIKIDTSNITIKEVSASIIEKLADFNLKREKDI